MSENYTLINWQNGEITQPAVVEIDGVDYQVQPAIETGNTPINADNLNHMDNGIRNATLKLNDKIEIAAVKLIAVSETAPEECVEGDRYYNTSTNLIYTATGTDTWGVTGEAPNTLYVYMDTDEQKLYYYDGTTFSTYGGGSGGGDEIYIGDEQDAPASTKLLIDDDMLPPIQSEVVNSLSGNETTKAPSVKAVNDRFTYSTTEQIVGEWVDGKPIYRKTIYDAGGSSGNISIAHNISNLDRVIKCEGIFKYSNHDYVIPRISSDGNNVGFDYISSVIHLYIPTAFGNNVSSIYITIEYTKTTD